MQSPGGGSHHAHVISAALSVSFLKLQTKIVETISLFVIVEAIDTDKRLEFCHGNPQLVAPHSCSVGSQGGKAAICILEKAKVSTSGKEGRDVEILLSSMQAHELIHVE